MSTTEEQTEDKKLQQMLDNRRTRFVELLGEDCEYIDGLVIRTDIHPTDVKTLLDNDCPKQLIPEILF